MQNVWNKNLLNYLKQFNLLDESGDPDFSRSTEVWKAVNSYVDAKERQEVKDLKELEMAKIVLDNVPCTVSWVHSDMTYGGVNKNLADVCNLKREDFVGEKVGFYTLNKQFTNFTEMLFKDQQPTLYQEIETKFKEVSKQFWVVGSKFNDGKSAVIIGIDVTELRNLERNVNFMEKLSSLGEMVAGIVHEINNPLMVISGQKVKIGHLLKKGKFAEIPNSLEKIQKTTNKIAQIIRGVKSFVRHGDQDPMASMDLCEVVNDAFVMCEGKLKPCEISVEIDLPETTLMGNTTQVFQVFVNLITNSIDAMEGLDKKWIKVARKDEDDKICIYFTDAGDGIPKDVEEKIFESFFTTKSLGKGTGLGLSLCRKIMKEHSGDLVIDRDYCPNTTFKILFSKS